MNSDSFQVVKRLCQYRETNNLKESGLLKRLKSTLSANPDVVHEVDIRGKTLLHYAAMYRSVEFCKLLLEFNPQAVRVTDRYGELPFYLSCYGCPSGINVETAKYLYELYPESIDIADAMGSYPIHCLCRKGYNFKSLGHIFELTQFLLKHDRGAVAKPTNFGRLPLHLAAKGKTLSMVKLVFDAYPEAIYVGYQGKTFLQIAKGGNRCEAILTFLKSQLEFARQSAEDTTPDENGQLPIHRGLFDKVLRLGTVKLIVKANPTIINAADNQGCIPLHIACQVGDSDIVENLIETNIDSLEINDFDGNCALHHACLAGNCDIINCILYKSALGSSARNSNGMLPIQVLLYKADCNRGSLEYVSAIYGLLLAYPNVRDIAV